MTNPKDENQKTKIPYEPPRLFDLGVSVAHAQGKGKCASGGSAFGGCKSGTRALGKCLAGDLA